MEFVILALLIIVFFCINELVISLSNIFVSPSTETYGPIFEFLITVFSAIKQGCIIFEFSIITESESLCSLCSKTLLVVCIVAF